MNNDFRSFLQHFLGIWKSSSLHELKDVISKDYKAREITSEGVLDSGMRNPLKVGDKGFHLSRKMMLNGI